MILASKSPRRKEILEDTGFKIQIKSAQIEEISDKISITDKIMDQNNHNPEYCRLFYKFHNRICKKGGGWY